MNVVDSSGWIEYLQDTPRADLFAAPIEDRNHLLVPTISLFEVHRVLRRSLNANLLNRCLDVMRLGRVLDFTDARAVAAAHIATRHKLAMADAAMYAMACEFGATFWTQDADYQGMPDVRFFAKS